MTALSSGLPILALTEVPVFALDVTVSAPLLLLLLLPQLPVMNSLVVSKHSDLNRRPLYLCSPASVPSAELLQSCSIIRVRTAQLSLMCLPCPSPHPTCWPELFPYYSKGLRELIP